MIHGIKTALEETYQMLHNICAMGYAIKPIYRLFFLLCRNSIKKVMQSIRDTHFQNEYWIIIIILYR